MRRVTFVHKTGRVQYLLGCYQVPLQHFDGRLGLENVRGYRVSVGRRSLPHLLHLSQHAYAHELGHRNDVRYLRALQFREDRPLLLCYNLSIDYLQN